MSETPDPAPTPSGGPLRIKLGKVKPLLPCTRKLAGCKARDYGQGNVFPIDHPTGTFKAPIDHVCSSCLTKLQDSGEWQLAT